MTLHVPNFVRVLCACALVGLAACAATPDSLLESGEHVSTGEKRFDAFFDQVAELRDKVDAFDSDLFPVREPLTDEMQLDVDITMAELLGKVRKRAVKFRDFGVTLNLRLTPEPKLLSARGKLEVDEKDERVLTAIEESARRGLAAFREYGKLLERAAELEAQRAELAERYDKLDEQDPNRDRIRAEILGAGRVLDEAERKLLRDSRTLGMYLIALADSVDTGAVEAQQEACEKPSKRPAKPKAPRRPYRPPPKPAGDDFEM